MSPLEGLRRSPYFAGAVLLLIAGSLAAPLVFYLGWQRWPLFAGAGALLLLAFGSIERLWQGRAVRRPSRPAQRRHRLKLVPGGKGNGHAHDGPDDSQEKPRWVM